MNPDVAKTKWKGFIPTITIMMVATSTVLLVSCVAHFIGKAEEDARNFLVGYRQADKNEVRIVYTMEYVTHSSEYNDVVFFGDSTCGSGINVRQFEHATGFRAFNLSYAAWIGFEGYVLILQKYLQAHPKPKMIVLCLWPQSLDQRWAEPVYRERLLWAYGDGSERLRPAHPWYQYVIDGLRIVHYQTISSVSLDESTSNTVNSKGREEYLGQRGSLELSGTATDPLLHFTIDITPSRKEAFRQICQILSDNGILLMIRWLPPRPGQLPDSLDNVHELTRAFSSRWNNVSVAMPEDLEYGAELYYDNYHLNSAGMRRATNEVTFVILKTLKGQSK